MNYGDSQALSGSNALEKPLLHGQEYRRAAAPSGPLSYCFGTATSGEPSTWSPLGELEGQEPLPLLFSRNFENLKNNLIIFQLFQKVWLL